MIKRLTATALATAFALAPMAATADGHACSNDVWNKVMSRGKIVVGVKADYKPWGYRDSTGEIVGMEIDMAKDVADKMGVDIELVAVQSSNRMQFLEQGKIDLMIATMSDRKDRREIVGIVGPNYYTSGTNIMSPQSNPTSAPIFYSRVTDAVCWLRSSLDRREQGYWMGVLARWALGLGGWIFGPGFVF